MFLPFAFFTTVPKNAQKTVLSCPRHHIKTVQSRPRYLINISPDSLYNMLETPMNARTLSLNALYSTYS